MPKYVTLEWEEYQRMSGNQVPIEELKKKLTDALNEPIQIHDPLISSMEPWRNGPITYVQVAYDTLRKRIETVLGK